jgi:hypothetical protein
MKKYERGRTPTKEDKERIEKIFEKLESVKSYRGDEWYLFAALQELANSICDYFMDIGYWEEPWEKK